MKGKVKATRHNGRAGKHGAYNADHNDRHFKPENSDHIRADRIKLNIYWDCFQGRRAACETGHFRSFKKIEDEFYTENYGEFVEKQNRRNEMNGHAERNRTAEDIKTNIKTCPEECIYQLGNVDGSVDGAVLVQVTESFLKWFDESFGAYVHILDWALHMDEATPHIHERHVFDAPNQYGELAPQQDKALELLGIELPYPDKKKSKNNNRKMVFDAMCRNRFLEICEEYGISVDKVPEFGGKKYMEKNDYIIQKQKMQINEISEEVKEKQDELDSVTVKLEAVGSVVDFIAEAVFDETCKQVINDTVPVLLMRQERDIEICREAIEKEERCSYSEKSGMDKLSNKILRRISDAKDRIVRILEESFLEPYTKMLNVEKVKTQVWKRLESFAEKESITKDEEEIATQIIRRRRGR